MDSLEVSHFQLHCTTRLCYLPLQDAKSIPVASLCALTFSSFSRMGHPPGDTGSYSASTTSSALFQPPDHDNTLEPENTAGPSTTCGRSLGAGVPPNSSWHPTGEYSSAGHKFSSSVAPDERSSVMGSCCNHTLLTSQISRPSSSDGITAYLHRADFANSFSRQHSWLQWPACAEGNLVCLGDCAREPCLVV